MTPWQDRFRARTVEAADALRAVRRGARVFVGSGCAEPVLLVEALAARDDVADVEVLHIMTVGHAPYAQAAHAGRFRHNAFFIGSNVREAVAAGQADYTPVFLSEIPALFRSRRLKIDVALVTVSPPDRHGWCSLGVSVDIVKTAVECAAVVVAEVNPTMPRTHGAGFVHVSEIDAFVRNDRPILELAPPAADEVSRAIGRFCADLIDHGSTLQLGIGAIPNAVLERLGDKRDLGLHTEMVSDGILPLIESGVVTGRAKTVHPRKAVTSFCIGSRRLYDYVNDNPYFEFLPTEFVNDPQVIARNDRMVSLNSALQVDLTGQVCADSIGTRFYSGIGGQVDFIRGAARSRGGRSILALPSTAKDGSLSRLVPTLSEGAGVVTTRGDVHYVVTEHGIADLKGRTVRERALALISIADPKFRGELLAAARQRRIVPVDQRPWPEGGKPYPVELESDETFGTIPARVRPLRPSDERMLREFFYAMSAETIEQRFIAPLKSLTPAQIQELCVLDYDTKVALAAFVRDGDAERMIAVARYTLDRATGLAEMAIVVHDEFQGRGLGTWLLKRLTAVARERGVAGFVGWVRPDNVRMMNLYQKIGGPVETATINGLYRVIQRFDRSGDTTIGSTSD